MPTFQIGGEEDQKSTQRLAVFRGYAINAYAGLEQALCRILSVVGKMPDETAETIFFKITSSRSRSAIISSLKKNNGDQYNLFWNSLIKEVGQLDEKRNQIIHWHAITNLGTTGTAVTATAVLAPPNYRGKSSPNIKEADLIEFMERCGVYTRAFTLLRLHWGQPSVALEKPFLDIFQQALTYPLPDGHPLSQKR